MRKSKLRLLRAKLFQMDKLWKENKISQKEYERRINKVNKKLEGFKSGKVR